jgi:large subunit ribosomal protein L1
MADKKVKTTDKVKKVKTVVEKKKFDDLVGAINYLKSFSEGQAEGGKKRKFVETFDIAVNLGLDIKLNQVVRGSVILPAGTGKDVRVIVFTDEESLQQEALSAGAIMVGLDDLMDKINAGFLDFDYCIATPEAMKVLSKVAKKLGPRGLMPNPKNGNITKDIKKAVNEARKGKVNFKNDKYGIVHVGAGKINFSAEDLKKNVEVILSAIKDLKPEGIKGKYIKSLFVSTTMGPSVEIASDNL